MFLVYGKHVYDIMGRYSVYIEITSLYNVCFPVAEKFHDVSQC